MHTITNFQQSLDDFCRLPASTISTSITGRSNGKHADVYLYGIIGSKRINAHVVQKAIDKGGKPDTLTIYLNTIGGTFAEGLAIYNTIKQHSAHTTIKVMGYALSMGSLIMMAGNHVECADNGLIMIHRPQGLSFGDVDDHEEAIQVLKQHDQTLITTYRKRMNKSDDAILALLKAETWYTAAEAKQVGLVDAITGEIPLDKEQAKQGAGNIQVANFRNPPQAFRRSLNRTLAYS